MTDVARGLIIGGTFDTLVVQATAEEVAKFGQQQAVVLAQRSDALRPGVWSKVELEKDPFLYNKAGEPIAVVMKVDVFHDKIDVTSFGDSTPQFMHGLRHVVIEAEGL